MRSRAGITSYDLVFVGSGVSCAYTLVHYLAFLGQEVPARPVRFAIIEKSGEFWAGVPYGYRSGASSLIITALKEFLPEPERASFVQWLNRNREAALAGFGRDGRQLAAQWLRTNESAMASGQWDDLFLPRSVFGLYLQQKLTALLDQAAAQGLIEFDLLKAEVLDIQRDDDGYRLTAETGPREQTHLLATKVVLTLGSPPNRTFEPEPLPDSLRDVCWIEDIFEPGLDLNVDRVGRFLQSVRAQGRNQILIVGSNASALEVLYNLVDRLDIDPLIDKFIVAAPEAKFPYRIGGTSGPSDYRPAHLESLLGLAPFTASQILDELVRDVQDAEAHGINVADVFQAMSRAVLKALDALSAAEQEKFVTEYGVKLGRWQRRAGAEYRDLVDRLSSKNRLQVLKGEYVRYLPANAGGPGCEYVDRVTRETKRFVAPLGAIVNCAGFSDVTDSPSPLIRNLLRRGLCVANASNRGFVMNERFETSPNCYLMGPLVAGNLNRSVRVWHAESCPRIIALSRMLAEVLFRVEG
jgi:uncharacterized NAD(P)/FAD-binding protein YdhS